MDLKTRSLIAECFWLDAEHYRKLGAIQDCADVTLEGLVDFDAVRDACLDLCGIPADNWETVTGDCRPDEFCRDSFMEEILTLNSKHAAMLLVDDYCKCGHEIQAAGGLAKWRKAVGDGEA